MSWRGGFFVNFLGNSKRPALLLTEQAVLGCCCASNCSIPSTPYREYLMSVMSS